MTDINQQTLAEPRLYERTDHTAPVTGTGRNDDLFAFIELFFFAYRDFISDPDIILAEIGFGRAHHRVLHFVSRYPGMRVADLLDILKITKQSLARVLKELIDKEYIRQRAGDADRRERLLYATARGSALARRLARTQLETMNHALARSGPKARQTVATFLSQMISESHRGQVMARIAGYGGGINDGNPGPDGR